MDYEIVNKKRVNCENNTNTFIVSGEKYEFITQFCKAWGYTVLSTNRSTISKNVDFIKKI